MKLICFVHGHETYVERDDRGVLNLICHACGYRTPAIDRSKAERARMSKKYRPVELPKAQRVGVSKIARMK